MIAGRAVRDDGRYGKASEAVERLRSHHDMFGVAPEDATYGTLWWNLRGTYWYLESNPQYLVKYGWRYRRGMPITGNMLPSLASVFTALLYANGRAIEEVLAIHRHDIEHVQDVPVPRDPGMLLACPSSLWRMPSQSGSTAGTQWLNYLENERESTGLSPSIVSIAKNAAINVHIPASLPHSTHTRAFQAQGDLPTLCDHAYEQSGHLLAACE